MVEGWRDLSRCVKKKVGKKEKGTGTGKASVCNYLDSVSKTLGPPRNPVTTLFTLNTDIHAPLMMTLACICRHASKQIRAGKCYLLFFL